MKNARKDTSGVAEQVLFENYLKDISAEVAEQILNKKCLKMNFSRGH